MTKEIEKMAKQAATRARIMQGALAEIEGMATGDLPIYHDAAFLRSEFARVMAECRAAIADVRTAE